MARAVYHRDLKIAAMRALDAGSSISQAAQEYQVSPKVLERWYGEWRAKGEAAFAGIGRQGAALVGAQRIAELERQVDRLTAENNFLKRLVKRLQTRGWQDPTGDAAPSSKRLTHNPGQ